MLPHNWFFPWLEAIDLLSLDTDLLTKKKRLKRTCTPGSDRNLNKTLLPLPPPLPIN